jgi:hypothetical protein
LVETEQGGMMDTVEMTEATKAYLVCTTSELYAVHRVVGEMKSGRDKFGEYNSRHEAWAVIREELDELWEEVRSKEPGTADVDEAIQVAATALRYVIEFSQG